MDRIKNYCLQNEERENFPLVQVDSDTFQINDQFNSASKIETKFKQGLNVQIEENVNDFGAVDNFDLD